MGDFVESSKQQGVLEDYFRWIYFFTLFELSITVKLFFVFIIKIMASYDFHVASRK